MRFQQLPSVPRTVRWAAAGALAALLVLSGLGGGEKAGGDAKLISYEPLPEMQADLCAMPSGTLMAAPLRMTSPTVGAETLPARYAPSLSAQSGTVISDPLRVIRDPYPAFSAVAVDMVRDEVAVTDENNFQILVYDRLDNTPPTAAMTKPKRVISGPHTEIEFQSGLYIDQTTGDIFASNNDTRDKVVVFSRQAEGDVPPDRWFQTPHGTFAITADEQNQELFLTVQHDSAVVVYNKMAGEEEAPLRLLQGNRTRLADPHGIAVDAERNFMFVANYGSTHEVSLTAFGAPVPGGIERSTETNWPLAREYAIPGSGKINPPSITVYSRTASGNTAPLRVIEGANTRLNWPTGVAFHSERDELFVTNDMTNSILVFRGDADGNVAPVRSLEGPRTGIENPTGIYLDTENDELWVANFGNHSLTVYAMAAEGDVRPRRTIRSTLPENPSLMIGNPSAVAYDSRRGEILVPN